MRDLIIDMDDTKHPFYAPFYEFHDELYGSKPHGRDEARSIRENLKLADEVTSARILEFYKRTDPTSLKPIPGLIEALDALGERYDLWVFTARDESAAYFTEAWMEHHIPGRIKHERVVHTSSDGFRTKRSKLDVARELGLEPRAIVEDRLETAREFARAGIDALLVPYAWNAGVNGEPRIYRASSLETAWDEIAERLLSTQT